LTPLPLFAAPSERRPLLAEMQVPDTCGTGYGDHLAACTPFRCQKPHPSTLNHISEAGNVPA